MNFKYYTWLDDQLTYSEKTRKIYSQLVSQVDLENIIQSMRKHLAKDADKTYNLRIVALKNYSRFLDENKISKDLIQEIFNLKRKRFVRSNPHKPFTQNQVHLLLEYVTGWKEQAINIALYSGLRQSEIAAINEQDIDFVNRKIKVVKGKGGKSRIIPIPEVLYDEMIAWQDFREKNKVDNNWLFLINSNKRPSLSSGGTLSRISEKLGFKIKWHSMRATYAKTIYEKSTHDIRLVQKLLGHASISTTEKYITFFDEEIQNKVNNLGNFYN